jgi:hypothetical protein
MNTIRAQDVFVANHGADYVEILLKICSLVFLLRQFYPSLFSVHFSKESHVSSDIFIGFSNINKILISMTLHIFSWRSQITLLGLDAYLINIKSDSSL